MLNINIIQAPDLVNQFIDHLKTGVANPETLNVSSPYEPEPDGILHAIKAAAMTMNQAYAVGSGRITVIFKEEGFVIKVPYNNGGLIQNKQELERRRDSETTDVLEARELFGHENFILVNPYYQPVSERFDELISEILDQYPNAKRLDEVITYELLDSFTDALNAAEFAILDYAVGLVAESEDHLEDHDGTDDCAMITEFWELVDDHAMGVHLADNFSGWVDENIENFGISEYGNLILLDAGLASEYQLNQIFSDEGLESFLMQDLCVL